MGKDEAQGQPAAQVLTFDLQWEKPPEGLQTVYANQLLISHAGNQFYLFFGEVLPPLVGDIAEALKAGEVGKTLPVRVVAQIALSPKSMLEALEIIQRNVENFMAEQEAAKKKELAHGRKDA